MGDNEGVIRRNKGKLGVKRSNKYSALSIEHNRHPSWAADAGSDRHKQKTWRQHSCLLFVVRYDQFLQRI